MPVHPDPWPGESLSYYDALVAAPVVDSQLWRDLALRSDTGRTIAAGEVWHVYYEADTAYSDRYLDDPTADVVVSWVVEVNGGTGTLAAAEGVHASFPDASDTAPASLGTFPVSGASTVVIGSVLMGAAEVVNSGPFYLLRLACTSGSLDVQQVKLRVWPSAGVGGGWSDVKPSWQGDTQEAVILYATPGVVGNGEGSSQGEAYDAARDAYASARTAAAATQPRNMSTTGTGLVAGQATNLLGFDTWTANWTLLAVIAIAQGADWRGMFPIDTGTYVEGVDWTRPPTEVPNDRTLLTQQVGEGATGWADAAIEFTAVVSPGDTLLTAAAGDYADDLDPDPDGVSYALPLPLGGTVIAAPQTVDLPTSGRDLFVAVAHSMPELFPGYTSGANFGVTAHTYPILPPYRFWVPVPVTPPEDTISILRHYPRNDGRRATSPRRYGQQSSRQSGRGGGYQ